MSTLWITKVCIFLLNNIDQKSAPQYGYNQDQAVKIVEQIVNGCCWVKIS